MRMARCWEGHVLAQELEPYGRIAFLWTRRLVSQELRDGLVLQLGRPSPLPCSWNGTVTGFLRAVADHQYVAGKPGGSSGNDLLGFRRSRPVKVGNGDALFLGQEPGGDDRWLLPHHGDCRVAANPPRRRIPDRAAVAPVRADLSPSPTIRQASGLLNPCFMSRK